MLTGCGSRAVVDPLPNGAPLTHLEASYQQLRYAQDRWRHAVALALPAPGNRPIYDSLTKAQQAWREARERIDTLGLGPDDRRALATMDRETSGAAAIVIDPLVDSIMARYRTATERIIVDVDTLNRLEILGRLGRASDGISRKRMFLALAPAWQSINGHNEPGSPYRTLLRLRGAAWGDTASPIAAKAPAFGITNAELERWLEQALSRWRAAVPDSLVEPWDWYYAMGEANRRLTPRVGSLAQLRQVNDRYYRRFGADPVALHVEYDLTARVGKSPVAYTDFGTRNRWDDGHWIAGEPYISTSYLSGGFDNLAELLHESGHAIHIAAIHTRPAFVDWPDNDTFTEALADLAALDLYEPAWQQEFLGDSVPLAASLRAKYASIIFDMAWALFEIRVHATADADPNAIWSDITSRYLGIKPHPEWSWWAMRGQLIDGPGYLINYALGAFMVADLRAATAKRWGSQFSHDPQRYARLSSAIYRFGLECPSRTVLEQFLGRPMQPDALLADLHRLAPSHR